MSLRARLLFLTLEDPMALGRIFGLSAIILQHTCGKISGFHLCFPWPPSVA